MSEFKRFEIGTTTVTVLSDGTTAFPAEFLLVGVPENERNEACSRWGVAPNAVTSYINVVHMNLNGRSILFDTGAGGTMPGCGQLPDSLTAAGIDRGQIDAVIHTHAHLDHLGWNVTADGAPMFPNATYFIGETELAFWSNEETHAKLQRSELWNLPDFEPAMSAAARNNLLALGDRVQSFPDCGEPVPGVRGIPAYGHTPGHLVFEIDLEVAKLIVLGDVVLSPFHLDRREWYPGVDLDPTSAIESRSRVLDAAADEGAIVVGYHLPFPGVGNVKKSSSGWRWVPVDDVQV